jgi:hypothetical protein
MMPVIGCNTITNTDTATYSDGANSRMSIAIVNYGQFQRLALSLFKGQCSSLLGIVTSNIVVGSFTISRSNILLNTDSIVRHMQAI